SGCIVGRGAYVGPGVVIGDNVKLQNYALVYEPARLEDGVFIGPAAGLTHDLYPRSVDGAGKLKRPADWGAHGVGGPAGGGGGWRGRAWPRNRVLGHGCGRGGSDPRRARLRAGRGGARPADWMGGPRRRTAGDRRTRPLAMPADR